MSHNLAYSKQYSIVHFKIHLEGIFHDKCSYYINKRKTKTHKETVGYVYPLYCDGMDFCACLNPSTCTH